MKSDIMNKKENKEKIQIKGSRYNMKKGISLIVLIITIIVIIILAGAVILSLNNTNIIGNANKAVTEQDKVNLISAYQMFVIDSLYDESINGIVSNITLAELAGKIGKDEKYLTDNKFSIDANGNLCEDGKVIVYKTSINGGNTTPEVKPESGMTNNGNVENVSKILAPKLYGMTPVKVTGDDSLNPTIIETTENDSEWYKYVAQTGDNGESVWANAKTKDGSLFVWIPRYAYKITPKKENEDAGTIDVKFIDLNDKIDGGKSLPAGYIVHSAFNLSGDEKLSGIWVGKYEASNNNGKVAVKPKAISWNKMEISTIFNICYSMQNNSLYGFTGLKYGSTHMMKNTEWGAAAYLAHSQYGRNGNEVSINSSSNYITGTGGVVASTTKNMSGIFDMSGCTSEYVVGNLKGLMGAALPPPKSIDFQADFEELFSAKNTKYFNIYMEENQEILGDATLETSGWHLDKSNFVSSSSPWFRRGGDYANESAAGIFCYNYTSGGYPYGDFGFRVVIFG